MKNIVLIFGILIVFSHVQATTLTLVTLESPPAEFLLDGKSTGRNVDITRECLRRMGFLCEVKIVPWKRALIMVENGIADGIIDAAHTPERGTFLHYPDEEIYSEEWYAFKRRKDPVSFDKGLTNVGTVSLGISRGFEYGGLIQDAIDNHRFKRLEEVVNNEMNIKKLLAGRFDAFVGVKLTILSLSKKMGYEDKISMVPKTGSQTPYLLSSSKTYVAFSKKTMTREIAVLFSMTLKQMKADGTVHKIERNYY